MLHITAGSNVVSQLLYMVQYYLNPSISAEMIMQALLSDDESHDCGTDEGLKGIEDRSLRRIFDELMLYEKLLRVRYQSQIPETMKRQ